MARVCEGFGCWGQLVSQYGHQTEDGGDQWGKGAAVNKSFISIKEVKDGVEQGMRVQFQGFRGNMIDSARSLKADIAKVGGTVEELGEEVKQVEKRLKTEIEKVKASATNFIPECLVCLETLGSLNIVQCMQGHKICEPCSVKEEVVACPDCKMAFLGRDMGMEAFVQGISAGSPVR